MGPLTAAEAQIFDEMVGGLGTSDGTGLPVSLHDNMMSITIR